MVREEKMISLFTADAQVGLKRKDFIWMLVFTAIFAVMVFWNLGSHAAPETYETFTVGEQGHNEIVLNFDRQIDVARVWIFLGGESKREISFSYWDIGDTQWNVLEDSHVVESVYCWNAMDINHTATSLGLVLMKDKAYINEIVIVDTQGNKIIPSNATAYPELFDEQKLFPNIPSYYNQTMFDEVYHARTAYEFLHHLPIYENTHPPLGKTLISLGIRWFGMNPFGWRFICAVCGCLMVPVFYIWAYRMLGGTMTACFVCILYETGFMTLTLSRIATIDIIVALFVVLMFAFMYGVVQHIKGFPPVRKTLPWMLCCGISMGLAVATKWTGVYAAVGIAIIFFYFLFGELSGFRGIREHSAYLIRLAGACVVCFIAIPLVIYVCSYVPFAQVYTDKGLIGHAISNGQLMLAYHSKTIFDHPYSSQWYEWLIDKRPLWESAAYLPDGTVRSVATFGNPLILWTGLAAVLHQIYLWIRKKNRISAYLVIAYASVLVPWMFIKRTVFIYQYFLGILILILMLAYSFSLLKRKRLWMTLFAAVNIGLCIMYYPVLTGLPVNVDFVNKVLEMLPSWSFA